MKQDVRANISKAVKLGIFAFLLTLLAPSMSFGQAVSARLVGSVEDSGKSRVVAATVVAHNVATGIDTKAVTDASGEYNFANILPGHYSLTASAEGFQTVEVKDLSLEIGDAKPRQGEQMHAADAPHSRNGDGFAPERLLFGSGKPAEIAVKRVGIGKDRVHQ